MSVQNLNCDLIDQLLFDDDDVIMPVPDFESEPHLLLSKVRKHYMDYMIKLLSINYETHQKLVNKNIYLPSAIWRCAKNIEMSAAQACMVVQIYRKNIISAVKELKRDTKKGKLHKNLYNCLKKPPENYKKTQTSNTVQDYCLCVHNKRKRRYRGSVSPKPPQFDNLLFINSNLDTCNDQSPSAAKMNCNTTYLQNLHPITKDTAVPCYKLPLTQVETAVQTKNQIKISSPMPNKRMSLESQDSDELMMQLEKLFEGETNDDLFEGALYDKVDTTNTLDSNRNNSIQELVIENHAAQIKSLDERLANLAGLLVNNDNTPQKTDNQKHRKSGLSKWLCEEYHLKQKLYELLDRIGDSDRKELEKIKAKFINLFGYDNDDEGVLSPLDETPEFVISCKERIAPWVVKLLTPYYIKGYIKGKGIFKALAKHLIRLIYQCSRYPEEYEVNSFVSDFLKNHKTIRCEADFKEFRIENI